MYFILTSRPFIASFFVTLALSVKAGVILLLPAFFGSIQYNFGTRTLLKCLILVAGFQVMVALPFVMGETSVKEYLFRSKLTGEGRNGVAYAESLYDYLAAKPDHTIFWRFIPFDIYMDPDCLAKWCKISMLFLNIYHFFLRKAAFAPCFNNLFKFLKLEPDNDRVYVQTTLEILMLGYLCGVFVMPGAHHQF